MPSKVVSDMRPLKPEELSYDGGGSTGAVEMSESSHSLCTSPLPSCTKSRLENPKMDGTVSPTCRSALPSLQVLHLSPPHAAQALRPRATNNAEKAECPESDCHCGRGNASREGSRDKGSPLLHPHLPTSVVKHYTANLFPAPRFSSLLHPSTLPKKKTLSPMPDTALPLSTCYMAPHEETPPGCLSLAISAEKSFGSSVGDTLGKGTQSNHGLADSYSPRRHSLTPTSSEGEFESALISHIPASEPVQHLPSLLIKADHGIRSADTSCLEREFAASDTPRSRTVQATCCRVAASTLLSTPSPPRPAGHHKGLRHYFFPVPLCSSPACSTPAAATSPTVPVSQHGASGAPQLTGCFDSWQSSLRGSPGTDPVVPHTHPARASTSILAPRTQGLRASRSNHDFSLLSNSSFGSERLRLGARDVDDDEDGVQQVADLVARMEGSKRPKGVSVENGAGGEDAHVYTPVSPEVPAAGARPRSGWARTTNEPHSAGDSTTPLRASIAFNGLTPGVNESPHRAPTPAHQETDNAVALRGPSRKRLEDPGGAVEREPPRCTSPVKSSTLDDVEVQQTGWTGGNDSCAPSSKGTGQRLAGRPPRDVAASVEAVLATLENKSPSNSMRMRRGRSNMVNFCL